MLANKDTGAFFAEFFPQFSPELIDYLINGPMAVWVCQQKPAWLYLNQAAQAIVGIKESQALSERRFPHCLRHLQQRPGQSGLQVCIAGKLYSYQIVDRDGRQAGLLLRGSNANRSAINTERDLQLLKLITQLPGLAIQGYDNSGRVIYWNQASTKLYGYEQREALGRAQQSLTLSQETGTPNWPALLKGPTIGRRQHCLRRHKNGQLLQIQSTPLLLHPQGQAQVFFIDFDSDGQRQQLQQLHELENYDQLTGLPNQYFLQSLLEKTLENSERLAMQTAVMFIGIDKFKFVNSEFGHGVGDKILQIVANRIFANVSSNDLKSRFGGDVYVLAFSLPEASSQAALIANRLLNRLSDDLSLVRGPQKISASIGIAVSPCDGRDAASLLKHADAALSQAKDRGGDRFVFFDSELNQTTHRSQFIARDIERAINECELELRYQPQLDIQHNSVPSCEALLRWQHPELGNISPAEFIPILEQEQSMLDLDLHVVSQALQRVNSLMQQGIYPPRIYVNISAGSINSAQFTQHLKRLLQQHQTPTDCFGIELTEHELVAKQDTTIDNLNWCRQQGIKIALDDFGTGFSSLSYLTSLPIDVIKIDKSFLPKANEQNKQELIKTIITIAHSLSMEVICEGVGSLEQEAFLKEYGCEMVQGNYYSPPLSEAELQQWIQQREL
ncbi:MAG: EAL domain-containing protein [Cellvibrionaceae bacterium]|nr:EAL domain-containing protein [Cellvibrionaceae bacterium]MCV6625684.1 EAL domain-containing protein [Cellvibrionaceae bacterium]